MYQHYNSYSPYGYGCGSGHGHGMHGNHCGHGQRGHGHHGHHYHGHAHGHHGHVVNVSRANYRHVHERHHHHESQDHHHHSHTVFDHSDHCYDTPMCHSHSKGPASFHYLPMCGKGRSRHVTVGHHDDHVEPVHGHHGHGHHGGHCDPAALAGAFGETFGPMLDPLATLNLQMDELIKVTKESGCAGGSGAAGAAVTVDGCGNATTNAPVTVWVCGSTTRKESAVLDNGLYFVATDDTTTKPGTAGYWAGGFDLAGMISYLQESGA